MPSQHGPGHVGTPPPVYRDVAFTREKKNFHAALLLCISRARLATNPTGIDPAHYCAKPPQP
jgi:hypothetical protein